MFLLASLFCYVSFTKSKKQKYYCLALVIFAFGLMAKPMLVTLPLLLILLDYWPLGRFAHQRFLTRPARASLMPEQVDSVLSIFKEKLPFLVLSVASSFITIKAQSSSAVISLGELPLSSRAANALVSYISYLWKLLWPVNLAAYYPFPPSIPSWQVAGSFTVLMVISVLAVKNIRRYQYVAFGWFWYIVTLIPVIGLVQVGAQSIADRYTYVPFIGLFIMITWGGFELVETLPRLRSVLAATSSVFLFILGILTWQQVGYWKDSESLYRHALNVTKDNWFAHANLGVELDEQGKFAEALSHFIKAVQLNPQYSHSQYSLGIALLRIGRFDEAIEHYNAAIQLEPNFAAARNNLANALLAKGNTDEAIAHFRILVNIQPDDAKYRSNLANALDKKGLLKEALEQYLEALRINPNSANTHNNLGSIYFRLGNLDEAAAHLSDAIRLDPSLTSVQYYLNYINSQRNRAR
jgi:tetratricopeptide (TPR) repeat protein